MATISFLLQGTKHVRNIYLKLSYGRNNQYKRKTGFSIHNNDWSNKKAAPIQRNVELKNLNSKLVHLKGKVLSEYNQAVDSRQVIDGNWLQAIIDKINNNVPEGVGDVLVDYCQQYIERLPFKVRTNGSVGVSENTVKKFHTLKKKLIGFEKCMGRTFRIGDVNMRLVDEFIAYLRDVDNLSINTIGKYVKGLKTVCNDARERGYSVSEQLGLIKGFSVKTDKVVLSFEELDIIEKVQLNADYLDNARNWLLIGCYTGQRVSDFMKFNRKQIIYVKKSPYVPVSQEKTGENVLVPLNKHVLNVLAKNNGDFPRKISDVNFNKYIKLVCKEAGLTALIEGSKMDKGSKRKKRGAYPKWELISSHVCRRSFATNYYGLIPTSDIMQVTGHSSEKQFLVYVGKPPIDAAQKVAEKMKEIEDARNNNRRNHLKIV